MNSLYVKKLLGSFEFPSSVGVDFSDNLASLLFQALDEMQQLFGDLSFCRQRECVDIAQVLFDDSEKALVAFFRRFFYLSLGVYEQSAHFCHAG